jgi:hypothetical protein
MVEPHLSPTPGVDDGAGEVEPDDVVLVEVGLEEVAGAVEVAMVEVGVIEVGVIEVDGVEVLVESTAPAAVYLGFMLPVSSHLTGLITMFLLPFGLP